MFPETMLFYCSIFVLTLLLYVQDVYRRLGTPRATHGLLRLRTSPEFRVVKGYGLLRADPHHDNLYYTPSSNPETTFAFDFDYESAQGFVADSESRPYVQIAYQYNQIVSGKGVDSGRHGQQNGGEAHSFQR